MILCKQHRFVFIKGRKVAGTSTEMALAALCGPEDIITPISPIDERARVPFGARNFGHDHASETAFLSTVTSVSAGPSQGNVRLPKGRYYNHMSIAEVSRQYGDLSDLEVLFVERNPYAKAISWANLEGAYGAYNEGRTVKSSPAQVRAKVERGLETGAVLKVRNIENYRYRGVVSAGWRYETLTGQLAAWASDKGAVTLPHAKEGLLSNQLDIRDWLAPAQIDRITELFWEEFETFGYQPQAARSP